MRTKTKIYKRWSQFAVAAATALLPVQVSMAHPSDLYGTDGELWTDTSRIPDFSHAGYRQGEYNLPNIPVVADVKADFGAVGDGVTDDTQAFLNAISGTNNGALFIPAGTYVINDFLRINKPNLVLRGAGKGATVLHFPTNCMGIEEIYDDFYPGAHWYHGKGGYIWVEGDYQHVDLADIVVEAQRGDRFLTVNSTAGLEVGQTVEIKQIDDTADSLAIYLYCNDAGDVNEKEIQPWQMVRIKSITDNVVEIDRRLHFDIRLGWSPKIRSFNPSVSEVGIEDLTITTARTSYIGHFFEDWNGIYFLNIADSWVKNVDIINADEAFLIKGRFCTLLDCGYTETNNAGTRHDGHNGVLFDFPGSDNLCINFTIGKKYMHTISVRETAGNVFSNVTGEQIDFDMASHVNYANLFTEIFTTKTNKIWESSGRPGTGKDAGAWSTFWNINSDKKVTSYPPSDRWAEKINIIGIKTNLPSIKDSDGFWFEAIDPTILEPQNLYLHQLNKRLASLPQGTPIPGTIQAEDFDEGVNFATGGSGDNITYNDTTPGNSGNQYRLNDDVDIRLLASGSGYAIGWVAAGEWLEFTVDVADSGLYSGSVRVASVQSTNKSFSIWGPDPNNPGSLTDLTGPVTFNTGGAGWDVWQSVAIPPISLSAGVQTLRYVMNTSSFDTDFIQLDLAPSVTEILFDDFETGFGNWIDGGKDCLYEVSGNFVNGTAGVINLQDNTNSSTLTTPDLALSAYSEVIVEFDYQVTNFNNVEDFWLQISTDAGATYETVKTYTRNVEFTNGTVYNDETVVITPTTGLTDQTRIRFRCDASNNSDDLYLDDIRISAQ